MKYFSAAFVLLAMLIASTGIVSAEKKVVSKAAALSAIDVFQKDPSSNEGFAAAETFMAFAQTSSEVSLYLSKDAMPWLKDKGATDADTRTILMHAYIAGNLLSQLRSGHADDDPFAGWQQVLATYAQLKVINPTVKVPEVETLLEKQKDGSLRAFATKIEAKHQAEQMKGH